MKLDMSSNEILDALRESKLRGPGPQTYKPDMKKILARPSPKIVFGNASRFELIFKERQWRQNPGPGQHFKESGTGVYKTPKKSGRKDSNFSRSIRQAIELSSGKDKDLVKESPGPGSYHLPKLIGDMPSY